VSGTNLIDDRGENRRFHRHRASGVGIKPVPALQQIGPPRLFGIGDKKPVRVGDLIHAGDFCVSAALCLQPLQQQDERRGRPLSRVAGTQSLKLREPPLSASAFGCPASICHGNGLPSAAASLCRHPGTRPAGQFRDEIGNS